MRHVVWLAMAVLLATASVAAAEPWWFDFEFNDPNDLPQGEGWLRIYQPKPFGTVVDGTLIYDSSDPQSYDFWQYSRPGGMDPTTGEVFACEWGLRVDWVSYWGDPAICIMSDDAWVVEFVFDVGVVHSFHEYVDIPIGPGTWHDYLLTSTDMRGYDLYIDGTHARRGSLAHRYGGCLVDWGDGGQGPASDHSWDYFRFGVVQDVVPGDVNCDGNVDFADINPFIQVLTTGEMYPGCWPENADINGDGTVDFADINPFVALLTG